MGNEHAPAHPGLYREAPAPDVAPFVKTYHVGVGDCGIAHLSEVPIVAWHFLRLVVHFADVVGATVAGERVVFGQPMLGGAISRPFVMVPSGPRLRFISTEFTPTGFFTFFGDLARDCRDSVVPLWDHVPAQRRRALVQQLSELPGPEQWASAMDSFFRSLPVPARRLRQARRVAEAAQLLETSSSIPQVRELAEDLGVSERGLRDDFRRVLGMSPKQYLDARRVDRAFRVLFDNPTRHGAEVAAATGYHDQAHFIRAIKAHTGFTPSKLPRERFAFARAFS